MTDYHETMAEAFKAALERKEREAASEKSANYECEADTLEYYIPDAIDNSSDAHDLITEVLRHDGPVKIHLAARGGCYNTVTALCAALKSIDHSVNVVVYGAVSGAMSLLADSAFSPEYTSGAWVRVTPQRIPEDSSLSPTAQERVAAVLMDQLRATFAGQLSKSDFEALAEGQEVIATGAKVLNYSRREFTNITGNIFLDAGEAPLVSSHVNSAKE